MQGLIPNAAPTQPVWRPCHSGPYRASPWGGEGPGPLLYIPCCRLACCLLGRTSWQHQLPHCGSPPLEVDTSHTLLHLTPGPPLTTHETNMGSGHPQNGVKGSALPRGALAVLCTGDAVGHTEVMPREGRAYGGKQAPGSCELNPAGNSRRQ